MSPIPLVLLLALASTAAAQDAPEDPAPEPPPAAPEASAEPVEPLDPATVAADLDPVADRALLDALLSLLSDETGVAGATALGELHDPRVLGPLVHTVEHRELPVALAAIDSTGRQGFGAPLATWVRDVRLRDALRARAAARLGDLHTDDGAAAILGALDAPRLSRLLRAELRDSFAAAWPERAAELYRKVGLGGVPWLAVSYASGLGFALGAVGHWGKTDLEALGVGTGVTGGALLGYFTGKAWPMDPGDASFLATNGVIGIAAGTALGSATGEDAAWTGGVLGGLLGFGAGVALRGVHQGTAADAVETIFLSGTTALLAGSTENLLASHRSAWTDNIDLAVGVGVLAGLVAGDVAAPYVDFEPLDAGPLSIAAVWGSIAGGLIPIDDASYLPPITGASAALVAYALAPTYTMHADVTVGAYTGMAYGAAIGAAIGWLADTNSYRATGPRVGALIGGTAGTIVGGALAEIQPGGISGHDVLLTGIATGWAGWQTAGWSLITEPSPELAGLIPLIPAVTGAAFAIASPHYQVRAEQTLSAASLGLWGGYLGAATGVLADAEWKTTLGLALVVSDVGLAAGGLVMSDAIGGDAVVVGLADAGGVLGGAAFALGTALFTIDDKALITASLVGSAVGAGIGTWVGFRVQDRLSPYTAWRPGPRAPERIALSPGWITDGEAGGFGLRLSVDGW